MAKAKRERRREQVKVLTKKQIARGKKVKRQQRVIWFAVASVTVLILAFLTIGILQEFVWSPRQPVAIVDGEEISRAAYQKRVRYEQWYLQRVELNLLLQQASYDPDDESQQFLYQYISSQIEQVRQQLLSVPTQALEDLIDEVLVREEAERRGLTVSDDEVQLAIEQQFGYERNSPELTPTPITTTTVLTPSTPMAPMTREQFDEGYSEYVKTLSAIKGFSEEDFRDFVKQSLLREELSEALAAEVPLTDEHVHAFHILVEDEETALEVLARLEAGESFADLVAEYSQDEDSVGNGGELGWLAADQFGVSVALVDAAFDLQLGKFSEVTETYQGYHIVTIDERRADFPLDESTLASRQAQAFGNWLTEAQQAADIERLWSSADVPSD